jgi:sugar lactone lactonase YvrE
MEAQAIDAPQTDDGPEAFPATPVFVSKLDQSKGQLTEGLWEIAPSAVDGIGTTGTPIVSYVVMGKIVAVAEDGGTADFGVAGDAGAQTTYTLGITTDATGSVYVGVAAGGAAPNTPAPGIWKFPPGGAGSVFSLGTAVNPAMSFANGLDFVGTDLFVADSEGVVYKIDAAGTAAVWSSDHLLAPDKTACGGVVPLPIGANGIVHDANNVYVTNTNFGRLIRIPIAADGSAGTPVVIKEDCATLVGADGLVIDPTDGTFIVALNIQNRVVRVTPTGTVTVLASGAPLASPASVLIDKTGNQRRLLVTNSTFFTAADAGSPGLLALPIP